MDALTIVGLFALAAMLIFYTLEEHSPWYIPALAGGVCLGAVGGFLSRGRYLATESFGCRGGTRW